MLVHTFRELLCPDGVPQQELPEDPHTLRIREEMACERRALNQFRETLTQDGHVSFLLDASAPETIRDHLVPRQYATCCIAAEDFLRADMQEDDGVFLPWTHPLFSDEIAGALKDLWKFVNAKLLRLRTEGGHPVDDFAVHLMVDEIAWIGIDPDGNVTLHFKYGSHR